MAGLSDVSVGEINNLGNLDDSQGEMANLSMADLDTSLGNSGVSTGDTGSGNLLDSLKEAPKPDNLNDSKMEELKAVHRKTEIFDEADEDDYDDEDD